MPEAQGLRVHRARSARDALALLALATGRRRVSDNGRHAASSRSHSVFTLRIKREMAAVPAQAQAQAQGGGAGAGAGKLVCKEGVLNLIDLAGSERLSPLEISQDAGLKRESNSINRSLSTLGRVITAIANRERQVPFRDSKLTFLLKPSLGGSCKTLMFCNIAPDEEQRSETVRSLRLAN